MTHGAHDDYIVALGFIQNDCPSRDIVDYEKNFVMPDKKQQEEYKDELER